MVRPLRAGALLSRTPVVTPKPSKFLETYYNYMSNLERRLMWTFPSYFYYKRGTLSQRKFNDWQRNPTARHKDTVYPAGYPDIHHNRDRRFKQNVIIKPDEQEQVRVQQPKPENDTDLTRLDRKLDQTLYLLVKEGNWKLPSFDVADDATSLHETAEQGLRQIGGELMNIWTVSNSPAGVLHTASKPEFLIKSHILHGKFTPQKQGTEFAWATKEEIKRLVETEYYDQVEALL